MSPVRVPGMDHLSEIKRLIEARRVGRLVEKVKGLDGEGRKEVAGRLAELVEELRGRADGWDGLVRYRTGLQVVGAAVLGGAAAVASWLYRRDFAPRWAGSDDVDLILAVLADRPAAWRADLARRLVLRMRAADDRGMRLALELLRETGIEPPRHDPLVAGWVRRPAPPDLGDDPLLDHLLPRLFEAEGVGRELQWETQPDGGWLGALLELVEAGRVKREMLLDGCIRRFLLGGTATNLRFFVHLHEALDPSPAEVAAHARDYLSLLPASPGTVAELAMKRLRAWDGLTAEDLAEAWESLLFRPERKLVRAGLSWLDHSVRRTPALADVIAAPLARAFAADSVELQEKAVELAVAHVGEMSEEGRALIREAIELLPAQLGHRAAAAFGGGTVAEAEAVFVPPPLPAAPARAHDFEAPIESVGELAGLMTEDWMRIWQEWERLLAGVVTFVGRDRASVVAALRPHLLSWCDPELLAWQYRQESWETASRWLMGVAHSVAGTAPVQGAWRRLMPKAGLPAPHLLLLHRAAEVLRAVEEDALPPLLLATPTHSTGHVAAAELVRRMEVIEAAGAKPLAADFQQALLRLPPTPDPEAAERAARLTSAAGRILAGWIYPEVTVELEWTCGNKGGDHDWHDRSHDHDVRLVPKATATSTGLPLVDLVLGVPPSSVPPYWGEGRDYEWWPSMLPSHREVAAAYLMPHLLWHWWNATSVVRDLVRAEGPPGAMFSVALARLLGDPQMPESVDILLEAAARDELPTAEIGRQVGLLLASGEVRMIDMVTALDAAARRGAHAQVWKITAAALPFLLPAPGRRPHSGLAKFVALTRAAAEWCGARGEIPEIRDMAARKGNSGLLREIRQLHDRLTGDTGEEG